jgi:hypothetical protein
MNPLLYAYYILLLNKLKRHNSESHYIFFYEFESIFFQNFIHNCQVDDFVRIFKIVGMLFVRDKNYSNNFKNNFEKEAPFKIFDFIYTEYQ